MKQKEFNNLLKLIIKAVSLAMGVAVCALSIMNKIETDSANLMLAFGLVGVGTILFMDKGGDN